MGDWDIPKKGFGITYIQLEAMANDLFSSKMDLTEAKMAREHWLKSVRPQGQFSGEPQTDYKLPWEGF